MRVFLWQRVDDMTDSYHNEAGVLVVAVDEERARALVRQAREEQQRGPGAGGDSFLDAVDASWCLAGAPEERLILFPDAGCC